MTLGTHVQESSVLDLYGVYVCIWMFVTTLVAALFVPMLDVTLVVSVLIDDFLEICFI